MFKWFIHLYWKIRFALIGEKFYPMGGGHVPMMMSQFHVQLQFLGRNDDGVESIRGAPGATDIAPVNNNFSWVVDVPFRLRILLSSLASTERNRAMNLRSNRNGAGYVIVSDVSSNVRVTDTIHYANQDHATEGIMGYPFGSWADDTNFHLVESGNPASTGTCNYPGDGAEQVVSAEFCLVFDTPGSYLFRLQRTNGLDLSSYVQTPSILVPTPIVNIDLKGSNIDMKGSNIDIK